MKERSGLFLDFDGTLADSLDVLWEVYLRLLEQFGLTGSTEEFRELNGPPTATVLAILRERYDLPESPADLLKRYRGLLTERYETVDPSPGAATLLRAAKDAGWVTAVVTSNAETLVRAWLTRTGLGGLVDFVVDGVAGGRGKPQPDPYLIALELCAASAPRSVAVEDSAQGVRAALGARLPTYVLNAHGRGAHETQEASLTPGIAGTITTLAELTVVVR